MRTNCIVIALAGLAGLPICAHSQAARLSRRIEYHNSSWSPDGRTLLFESTLNGKYSIYTINVDGSGLRHMTPDTAENSQASWSPDGKRILFSSDRAGGGLQIHVMNADGSAPVQLTRLPVGGYYQSSFSPDGSWIVFQGRADNRETRDRVYVMRSDGSTLRLVSDSAYGAEGPAWSPDGKSITFNQVPYPKRYWNEMTPADMSVARSGERVMSARIDGTALAPVNTAAGDSRPTWTRDGSRSFFFSNRDGTRAVYEQQRANPSPRRVAEAGVVAELNPSPDGTMLVYTKPVDGWYGLYVYDIAARRERLVTGGPAAGPLGYLRTAALTARSDTFDTYASPRDGAIVPGNGTFYIRAIRQIGARRFELANTWFDSAGQITARQTVRTAPGSLATDLETVRAATDSASLLVTADRVTAWVVRPGESARLYDAATTSERYAADVVSMAISRSQSAIGTIFVAPMHALFGANPVEVRVDSIRVLRRDSLFDGQSVRRVLVLERNAGQTWVDEQTGAIMLTRGNAGPNRWWWHIRRGVRPPEVAANR